jgi:hypothetical protein
MKLQNLKVIIDNKAFNVCGYRREREVFILTDGRVIGFSEVRAVLRGSSIK